MLIEATHHPIRYTMLDGRQVRLEPGQPVDLPETQARMLLTKAADRVRVIESPPSLYEEVQVDATTCKRPVYWDSPGQGILGPATVAYLAKETSLTGRVHFWLCINYGNSWRWIHEQTLRSRMAYDGQPGRPP